MKDYGLIVADNGSNFFFTGASQSVDTNNNSWLTWNDDDIQDSQHGLKSLKFNMFEVVDLTPRVTGLSATSGAKDAQILITGQNFSGAAGHLQVLFGNTPATSITILSDSQVMAVAPAGTGTVDIRVQSGVSDPNDPENIKSPIFGYGISATSAADRFTWTVPPAAFSWLGGSAAGPTDWDKAANWNPNSQAPNGEKIHAVFGNQSAANGVVDMISHGATVGSLEFAAATSTTIKSTGNFSLTLDNDGSTSTIVVAGSHTIAAPVILDNDAVLSGPGTLNLTRGISGNHTLTVEGNLTASSIQVDTLIIGSHAGSVPEPGSITLFLLAIPAILIGRRRVARASCQCIISSSDGTDPDKYRMLDH
jgi:hypothetical protein